MLRYRCDGARGSRPRPRPVATRGVGLHSAARYEPPSVHVSLRTRSTHRHSTASHGFAHPSQRADNSIAQKPTMSPKPRRTRSFGVGRQRAIIHKPGDRQQAYQCLLTFRKLAAAFQPPRRDVRHARDARGRRVLREPSPEPSCGTRASRNALQVHRVGTRHRSGPSPPSGGREGRGKAAPSSSRIPLAIVPVQRGPASASGCRGQNDPVCGELMFLPELNKTLNKT